MLLLGKIMILQGVGHPISCLGVCYANDPKKGGYMTPAPALDLTTSLRGDFFGHLWRQEYIPPPGGGRDMGQGRPTSDLPLPPRGGGGVPAEGGTQLFKKAPTHHHPGGRVGRPLSKGLGWMLLNSGGPGWTPGAFLGVPGSTPPAPNSAKKSQQFGRTIRRAYFSAKCFPVTRIMALAPQTHCPFGCCVVREMWKTLLAEKNFHPAACIRRKMTSTERK